MVVGTRKDRSEIRFYGPALPPPLPSTAMSNRIVPATYRAIIDDVMNNIRDHFQEFGVADEVLQTLQNKWEQKVVDSNVAEFEPGPPPPAQPTAVPQQQLHPPPPSAGNQFSLAVPQQPPRLPAGYSTPTNSGQSTAHTPYGGSNVKTEPHDSSYALPTLAAPAPPIQSGHRPLVLGPGGMPQPQQLSAAQFQQLQAQLAYQQLRQQQAQQQQPQQKPTPSQLQAASRLPQVDGPSSLPTLDGEATAVLQSQRIPQVDGPSSASSSSSTRSSASPPPQASSHAAPAPAAASGSAPRAGDEEIGSDLDDDDSDLEDADPDAANAADGSGPGDIVYCTYEKVQRVRNRWKCVLKDGIVSVAGKDYLFSKCTGELEW